MKVTDYTLLPHASGVYIQRDAHDAILYIGKAKDLRKRVASYFCENPTDPKVQLLAKKRAYIEYIVVGSELEALMLENQLIKLHKPPYNIQLKDACKYVYITITNEKYPRLKITRHVGRGDTYIGPYKTASVRTIIRSVNDIFRLRHCDGLLPKKACLYKNIGLCSAPCEGRESTSAYRRRLDGALACLNNGCESLRAEYQERMEMCSHTLAFEEALVCKKQLDAIEILREGLRISTTSRYDMDSIVATETAAHSLHIVVCHIKNMIILEKETFTFEAGVDVLEDFIKQYYARSIPPKNIMIDAPVDSCISLYLDRLWTQNVRFFAPATAQQKELYAVALAYCDEYREHADIHREVQLFLGLETYPETIDCFDISNFKDTVLVGSCVRFALGKPQKSLWRRGLIKTVTGQNDIACLQEWVLRRYEKIDVPDLIIVDGGIGQVGGVVEQLARMGLHVRVVGLAKREETIVFPDGSEKKLASVSAVGKYILSIRDATHTFGITYSRRCMQALMRPIKNKKEKK